MARFLARLLGGGRIGLDRQSTFATEASPAGWGCASEVRTGAAFMRLERLKNRQSAVMAAQLFLRDYL